MRDGDLGRRDLLQGPAEVDGRGPAAVGGAPGDGAIEGKVDFEDAGAVTKSLKALAVAIFAEIGGAASDLQPEIWKLVEW